MLPSRAFWVVAAALLTAIPPVAAGRAEAQEAWLGPTLAAIKRSQAVRLGYPEAALPFAFLDRANRPVGYSLDLCRAIVEEIGRTIDEPSLRIEPVVVNTESRLAAVIDGRVDLECGATTNDAERRRSVAFSPMIFLAGTKLMVPGASRAASLGDLRGRTVVVTRGTTNEQAIRNADSKQGLGLTIVLGDDLEHSYRLLDQGKAQALAADDILLYGLIARHGARDRLKVVGDYLSYDPYGIVFRKGEPQLAAAVERAFRRLATDHDLGSLYRKWFLARLSSGERLGMALSPQLEASFRVLGGPQSAPN